MYVSSTAVVYDMITDRIEKPERALMLQQFQMVLHRFMTITSYRHVCNPIVHNLGVVWESGIREYRRVCSMIRLDNGYNRYWMCQLRGRHFTQQEEEPECALYRRNNVQKVGEDFELLMHASSNRHVHIQKEPLGGVQ